MYKIALFVLAIVACFALVQCGGTDSICDRYSGSTMFPNNTALMTGFVTTAFGRLLDEPITEPYFTGGIGADINNQTIDYTTNTTAFNLLAFHLVTFFGSALGCTDKDFPAYNGSSDMAAVHKNNKIDKAAFEVFNIQLVNIAQVLGFNHSDYAALGGVLEGFRSEICTQADCNTSPHVITVGDGGNFFTPSAGYSFPGGTTIVWAWDSAASTHSVVQGSTLGGCTKLAGGFDSGTGSGARNFSQTFNVAGDYYFYCGVGSHCGGGMYGTFTITSNATTTTATTAASTATTAASTATTAASTATTAASTATTAASTTRTTTGNGSGASTFSVLVALVLLVAALLF